MNKALGWLIFALVLGIAVVLYYRLQDESPQERAWQPPPPAPPEPEVRYPIEGALTGQEESTLPDEPLPALADSDPALREALSGLFGKNLEKFFNLRNIIHRVVATVDNLALDNAPPQLMPVKPVPGWLVTAGDAASLNLSPKNAARYQPYVQLAEAVPTGPLVAVYTRFYPLFQEQYEKLGYPGKYFNDRLVQVIDQLLATPEVQGPVRLTQIHVLYQFTDPKLEALSAGQKILVRMGTENAAKIKAKLREIRSAVTSTGGKNDRRP